MVVRTVAGDLPVERLPTSALHRMLIWDFTAERIAERPLLGWGMEASRTVPGGRGQPEAAALDRMRVTDPGQRRWFAEPHVQILPLHPHNGALQLWLELGAVGVGARLREVAVRGHHAQVVLGAVGAGLLHLYLYGLAALVVAREAGVYRRAPAHGYSISSAAWNHTTVPITRTGPSSMPKIMSS